MNDLNKKIYLTSLLLFIYIGYYGTVSLFIHSHVYNGVVYLHSHPYEKSSGEYQFPIESHHHTSGSFFTLNQISAIVSGSTKLTNALEIILPSFKLFYYKPNIRKIFGGFDYTFHLRAPPAIFSF